MTSTTPSKPHLENFDNVLRVIHPLGLWQWLIYAAFAYVHFWAAGINLAVVFFQIAPPYVCAPPPARNWSFETVRNISTPFQSSSQLSTNNGEDGNNKQRDGCLIRNLLYYPTPEATVRANLWLSTNNGSGEAGRGSRNESNNIQCDQYDGAIWMYDTTGTMENTIVTEWSLLCEKKFLVEHTTLVYMLGFLIGSLISGPLSDKFGRKLIFIVASFLTSVLGIAQAYSPNYIGFLIIRFFMSLSNIAIWMTSFCMGLEIMNERYRTWIGALSWIPYALGSAADSLWAYLTLDWRPMHVIVSAPGLISILLFWLLPESPRWLLQKGQIGEAEKTLRLAAKLNKTEYPADLDLSIISKTVTEEASDEKEKQLYFYHIFKYPVLAKRAVNIFFQWFVCALVYYAVSLNMSSFAGSVFVNNAIAGFIEIPAGFASVPMLMWGRKTSMTLSLFLTGISLFIIPWLPKHLPGLTTVMALFGKLFITISFGVIYVFTTELYPTGPSYEFVPMLICGVLALAAGVLALFLPETKGKKLPNHIQDALELKPVKENKDSNNKESDPNTSPYQKE